MRLSVLALLALALAAPQPARSGDTEKPTPRQKARQLLDSAAEMTAATTPDVQATALMHLARNYQDFDRKKAIEFFKQSFTAATTPPIGQTPSFEDPPRRAVRRSGCPSGRGGRRWGERRARSTPTG